MSPVAPTIVRVTTSMLILMSIFLAPEAVAQNTKLMNVESCNGGSNISAESQINGCTALIDSGLENSQTLVVAYNNRGNAHTRREEYDLAIKDYDECIKLYPDYARAFNNRGEAFAKKGEFSRAIADFDAAISFDQKYGSAFANRAQIYEKRGKFDRALKDLDEAVRLLPGVGSLWNKRCWTRFVLGDLQVADCNEAIKLAPNSAAAFDTRGFIYLKLGQADLALADFKSALQFDPKLASALYGRGLANLKSGALIAGNADIAAAKAIDQMIVDRFARYGLN